MTPFFSIIIPIYNGLTHGLPRCIDSIYSQPLDAELYEVLCVDDCSADNTRQWLAEQQLKHVNLKPIHNTQNIRQGGARNHGVREANGKYIMFIDQDDYFHPKAIAQVYEHLQKVELDVLVTDNAIEYFGHTNDNRQLLYYSFTDITTGIDFVVRNGNPTAPWRMIIAKNFIFENNIWFEENCRIEDLDWGTKVTYYAKRIQFLPIVCVHYIKEYSNTSDNLHKDYNILIDNIKAGVRLYNISQTLYLDTSAYDKVHRFALSVFDYCLKYLVVSKTTISQKQNAIRLIPQDSKNTTIAKTAINHTMAFSIGSIILRPFVQIIRNIKRRNKQ